MPINKKSRFGNHTAAKGDIAPLTEKVVDMVENKIYIELNASPTPR
jgi:hypothetical protein